VADSSAPDKTRLVEAGIRAARVGQNAEAVELLKQALALDDRDEQAWLWLAAAVDNAEDRRFCLQNVLQINANNTVARRALDRLDAEMAQAPSGGEVAVDRFLFTDFDGEGSTVPPKAVPASPNVSRARFLLPMAGVVIVLVVVVIMLGSLLSPTNCCVSTPTRAPSPSATLPFIAQAQTIDAETLTIPPSPHGSINTVIPPPPNIGPGPSWTPHPTFTAPPAPTATVTPLPLAKLTIVFSGEGRGRSATALYALGADGKNERLLLGAGAAVSDPALSPDGKEVAYVQSVNGAPQLMVADADGSNPRALTHLNGNYLRLPNWSPDGKQIVFAATKGSHTALYIINAVGGDPTAITDGSFDCHDPAWSPDGKQIVYAADVSRNGSFQLYELDRGAGKSKQLTGSAKSNYGPAWSPDGTKIAFVSTRDGTANLYVMNADGSEQKLLSYDAPTAENRDPSWSSDGRWLAFDSNRAGGFALFVMSAEGSAAGPVIRLTDPAQQSFTPRFFPTS